MSQTSYRVTCRCGFEYLGRDRAMCENFAQAHARQPVRVDDSFTKQAAGHSWKIVEEPIE